MTVLDTFYLLFKSNADDLAKGAEKAGKAADGLEKKLRGDDKAAKDLGKSFVDIVESLGTMVTAYLSLDALKGGLANAQKFTADLQFQSKWLNQNAQDVAAWGGVVKSVGGTAEGFAASFKSLHDQYVEKGFAAPQLDDLLNLADQFHGISLEQAEQAGKKFGFDEGTILLLRQGKTALKEMLDEQKKLLNLTPQDTETARAFGTEWSKTEAAFSGLFNKINDDLLPILGRLLKKVREFVVWLQEHPRIAEGLIGALTAMAALLAGGAIAAGLAGLGAAAVAITPAFVALAAAIGTAVAAANLLPHQAIADAIDKTSWGQKLGDWLYQTFDEGGTSSPSAPGSRPAAGSAASGSALGLRNNNPGNLRPGGREASYATPEAGLAAAANNLRRYGRRGWDTVDSIISHWAPPNENNTAAYIAAVSRETGFAPGQKLDLNDPATLQKLLGAITRHENGTNPYSDSQVLGAISLGKTALDAASASPFNSASSTAGGNAGNSRSISIKTGDINVKTQATDADGIAAAIGQSLKSALRTTISGLDDGVYA